MVLKFAPDFAQQAMKEVLCDVQDTGIFFDNIGAFFMILEYHILLLNKTLHQL